MTADEAPPRARALLPAIGIVAAFVVITGITMWRHEMWRDELQAWQIARASGSFGDLLHRARYEGHPIGWFAVLWATSKVSAAPAAMQVVHLLIATASVTLIALRAPFGWLQKALLATGYYAVFEYGVISRNYALGGLLLIAACIAASAPQPRWPLVGLALAGLALTSAFGVILTLAIAAGITVDRVFVRNEVTTTTWRSRGTAIALVGAGVLLSARTAWPPADSGVYASWGNPLAPSRLGPAVGSVWRALVPVPRPSRELWNTNVLGDLPVTVYALLGAALFVAVLWLLRAWPGAATVWGVGAVGVAAFVGSRLGYAEALRHTGHIFLALLAAVWLRHACLARGDADPRVLDRAWTALLAVHVVAMLVAVSADLAMPFSNAKAAAALLRERNLDRAVIIGDPDTSASAVAGHLDREIVYPRGIRAGTYVIWDERRNDARASIEEAVDIARDASGDQPIVLLLGAPLPDDSPLDATRIGTLTDGMVTDEHYWIYLVATEPR